MNGATEQLKALMETGTEDEVRSFVAEHFTELPEDMQKTLVVELFKEALEAETKEREAIVALKEEAVEMIETIERAEREDDATH